MSEASQPRLFCWLPVVDEVRTKIYDLSRRNLVPSLYKIEYSIWS
jgi:hypothetical protein